MNNEHIGLIGLGLVGSAMAERLTDDGFNVVGLDIDPAKCKQLERLGGQAVDSPAQVGERVERVILSLPDSDAVVQVVEGPGGILEAETNPKYIIDTTTGEPDIIVALSERLVGRDIFFLDAPFSGSSWQVRDKEVVFMVGGEKAAFEKSLDIFNALGAKACYLGASGSGSKAKLAGNLILGLNRLALAEGLVFAARLGLEPAEFLELLKVTPAYSAVMDVKGKKMLEDDFEPEARLRQHHKDVSIILKYADNLRQELPLSKVHKEILEKAITAGDGELDNSAVIREIQRRGKA
jgi:3-hydroxyisobutyrate dehydrogenase-like beta-hydroxyacid dehydrogenase